MNRSDINRNVQRGCRGKCRGNFLLEVTIALVILSISILSVGQLQRLTMFQTREMFQRTQALCLASSTLERLRTHGSAKTNRSYINRSKTDSTKTNGVMMNHLMGVGSIDFEQIKTRQDCDPLDDFCIEIQVSTALFHGDLKPVRVVVSWQGQQEKTHQVALSTMISRFNEFELRLPKSAAPADVVHEIVNVTQ
jgi:type IV pilus assembly protein PilV